MPFYGVTLSAAAVPRRTPKYSFPTGRPVGSGGVVSGYRSFPERVDASDPAMTAIGMAAQAPAYVYERPLAVANQATGANQQTGDKGIVDQVSDFVDSLPIAGDIARGVGNVLEGSSRIFPAASNADMARALKATAQMADSDRLPAFAGWTGASSLLGLDTIVGTLRGDKPITEWTVGDLRRKAAERGWTRRDVSDLGTGKRGVFDFADKATSPNRLVDLAGRIVIDPLNATVIAGPGRFVSLAGRLTGAGPAAERILKVAEARAVVASVPALSVVPKGLRDGVRALSAGVTEGVTHRSLALFGMGLAKGGGGLLTSYRKAAIGTTAVQLGVNAIDYALNGDDAPPPGPFGDLYRAFRALRDDRPLSEGMLFNLWAVTHFPITDMAYGTLGRGIGAYRRLNPAGRDVRAGLVDLFVPGPASTHTARDARWVAMMGGEDSALDYIAHLAKKSRAPYLDAAFAERPVIGSVLELRDQLRTMDGLVADLVRRRPPSRQEMLDAAIDFATGSRGTPETQAGLRSTWSAERAAAQWSQWRSVASQASSLSGGAVVPQLQHLLVKEHLEVAGARFRAVARDGMVDPRDAVRIIMDNPALLTHETAGFWSRLLIRDAEPVPIGWVQQRIEKAIEDAVSRKSAYSVAAEWEARAGREAANRRRAPIIGPDGTMDLDRVRTTGKATVLAPTARNTARRNGGFPAETLEQVREARADPRVADLEDPSTIGALDEAGYRIDMVKQGVSGQHGALSPALEVTLGDGMGPQMAAEVASLLLRRSGSLGTARIVYVGDALDSIGLRPNAAELRWEVGRHDAAQAEQAISLLNRVFDETFVDDTLGVYRVVIPQTADAAGFARRLDRASEGMARIFPERVMGGAFDPQTQRAWTQTIRDTAGGNRRGRASRALGAERSVADVEQRARLSANWWGARAGFEERASLAGQAGPHGVADGLRPDEGPLRATAEAVGPGDGSDLAGLTPEPAPVAMPVGSNPDGLRWLQDRDAETAAFVPNYDASLTDRLSPEELARLAPLQADLALNDPTYTLSMAPKGGTPFRVGQGRAYADLVLAKQMAGDLWQYRVGSKVANLWHGLFGRVYTKRLQDDMKQELMSELVGAGATPKQVGQLLAALQQDVEHTYLFGSPLHQRLDMLPPKQIDAIARGDKVIGHFAGLPREVFAKLGPDGVSRAMNRSASRIFRKLEQNHRAIDGAGSLGKLLDLTYGPAKAVMDGPAGRGLQYLRAYYPLFRFKLDPRWHLMNIAEARIIGAARFGVAPREIEAGSRTALAMARTARGPMERSFDDMADSLASGWLDKRRLEGIIGPAYDVERLASTRKAVVALAQDDPIMVRLRERYGRTHDGKVPSADDLADELDRMLYDYDHKGVRATVDAEARKVLDDSDYEAMRPFLRSIAESNQRVFSDVIHAFHGNTNRSNIERLANSYFLYWPISYQLKVGKVLFDTLTRRMFGRQTDLLGAWTVDRLMKEHTQRLANDPGYREMFEENPELWRAAGMFLPITPMDIGVSLSRFTRYAGSALGAQLGLWGKDGSYPDVTTPRGVLDFGSRLMEMGPLYTSDLLATLGRELGDDR